jgi:hypothetical protein
MTAIYNRLSGLSAGISPYVADLKIHIDRDKQAGPTNRLVAMNNVIATEAICHSIRGLLGDWSDECASTEQIREIAEYSLQEALVTLVSKAPYSSSR